MTWWKLRDAIADEPFFKSIPQRILALLLRRAYKKASRELSSFDECVREHLSELSAMEAESSPSLDGAADKFALLLSAAAPEDLPDFKRRALGQLLYHIGRWIYIVDALDDLARDMKAGRYNPIAARFGLSGALSDDDKRRVETTLRHSAGLAASALELMPDNAWSEMLRNTVYLGLPAVANEVLGGTWKKNRKMKTI